MFEGLHKTKVGLVGFVQSLNFALGKRGFIRYVRSSAKRDEFGGNISAAWPVPSKGICCQNRPFCAEPEGKSHFSLIMAMFSILQKMWFRTYRRDPRFPNE